MSWISNIAGRAEEILNKIDQNAAVVLKKEKNYKKEYSSEPPLTLLETSRGLNVLNSSPMTLKKSSSKELLTCSVGNTSHHYPDLLDSLRHEETKNGETQCKEGDGRWDESSVSCSSNNEVLRSENLMLNNQVASLQSQLSQLTNRIKETDSGCLSMEERLSSSHRESNKLKNKLDLSDQRLAELENNYQLVQNENRRLEVERSEIDTLNGIINQLKSDTTKKEQELNLQIETLQRRVAESERSMSDLLVELSDAKERAEQSRQDLDQYRARAQRTLAQKHQLIEQLKLSKLCDDTYQQPVDDNTLSPQNNNQSVDVDNWSAECEILREQLETSRQETKRAEERLEFMRVELSRKQSDLVALSQTHANKLIGVRREMDAMREEHKKAMMEASGKLQKVECEMKSLKAQHQRGAHPGADNPEVRIANLTSALVRKQAALEQATANAAQLRIQLETNRNKWKEYNLRCQGSHVNDTDDVKARIPDRVFDIDGGNTGLYYWLKGVYLGFDWLLSSGVGLILRRFPMARVLALFYLILLHMMVCLVLYSWIPDTK